ncbi:hypothetical protein IWQ49_003936 [Labrenzia sp. EL_126]|nr:hypothetical protein [Labrenzia sp. EL_126]
MQHNNLLHSSQFAGNEVTFDRERIEASIEHLINLLDVLDAPYEDMEDDGLSEDDGNTEAVMTTDGYSA